MKSIVCCVFLAFFLSACSEQDQGDFNDPVPVVEKSKDGVFVGCIEYEVSHKVFKGDDEEFNSRLDLILETNIETYGERKLHCYSSQGDYVIAYPESKSQLKVVYKQESNTEYTVYKSGRVLYSVLNEVWPDMPEENLLKSVEATGRVDVISGVKAREYLISYKNRSDYVYWVSEDIILDSRGYKKNKLAYMNVIYRKLKGVPLKIMSRRGGYSEKLDTAVNVIHGEPNKYLFYVATERAEEWGQL